MMSFCSLLLFILLKPSKNSKRNEQASPYLVNSSTSDRTFRQKSKKLWKNRQFFLTKHSHQNTLGHLEKIFVLIFFSPCVKNSKRHFPEVRKVFISLVRVIAIICELATAHTWISGRSVRQCYKFERNHAQKPILARGNCHVYTRFGIFSSTT